MTEVHMDACRQTERGGESFQICGNVFQINDAIDTSLEARANVSVLEVPSIDRGVFQQLAVETLPKDSGFDVIQPIPDVVSGDFGIITHVLFICDRQAAPIF